MKVFRDHSYEIYIVGGAVRDLLINRPTNDWDFTTNATPEQITSLFPDSFYNNSFGTVGIPSKTEGMEPHEVTTFRSEEGYSDFRRPDNVKWGTTLNEDLSRRDFTINALAIEVTSFSPLETSVIDTFGGQKDIDSKKIKAVGDPFARFHEDALRMMRAVRIAAELGFSIEKHTEEAILSNAPLIQRIAKERVKEELFKIMASANPTHGIELMRQVGLLAEVLPELDKTFGVEQKSPNRHHIYDVGTHLLMSLKNCKSQDPLVRFATLIHDIGKPQTVKRQNNGVITFYNHEVVGSRIANGIAHRLRFSKDEQDRLFKLVRFHQFTVDERQTDSAIRRFIRNVGQENVEDMIKLRVADRLGGGARETSWRLEEFKERMVEVQKQPFSIKDLKINGQDVMDSLNIEPGRKVGELLQQLFQLVEEKKVENDREALLAALRSLNN